MSNSEIKICQNCKASFEIDASDFEFYEKIKVPAPTFCPECRMKRKLIWRNEINFYKRNCDLCGKSMISMYNPAVKAVFCHDCYFSEKWNPLDYGMNYEPDRPFFEQLKELIFKTPKLTMHIGSVGQSVNSKFVNFAGENKSCYLIFNSKGNEDSNYSRGIVKAKDSSDIYFGEQIERCYEGININNCNSVLWSQNSVSSLNSYFIFNCSGCQNCFGCVNLRHKSYYFFNEPLEKEEWKKRVDGILGSREKIEKTRKEFDEFSLKFPRKENNNLKAVQCFGDYLTESKNCFSCFEGFDLEDCKYAIYVKSMKDSYDVVGRGFQSELMLETVASGSNCSNLLGCWSVENARNVEYSFDIRTGSNCFGCVSLKHAEHYILNKKYSEEEYNILRERIVKELKESEIYGLYFPPEISPWAYNETLAQENYPLTKEQALEQGFRWEDNIPKTKGQETIMPDQIPDRIEDVQNSILKEVLKCENCGNNYRLVASELDFYREMRIPIPRECFNCRHLRRIKRRGKFNIYKRKCVKCDKEISTTYSSDRPEIVYCENCYNSEVV